MSTESAAATATSPTLTLKAKRVMRIKVTCKGTFDLMMDPMTDQVLEGLRTKVKQELQTDKTHEEIAASKIYRNEDGKPGIPVENLLSCLVEAGRSVKFRGKSMVSTRKDTKLFSFLRTEETFLVLTGDQKHKADARRAVLPANGVPICAVRPRFKNWGFVITVVINLRKVDPKVVQQIFEFAGEEVGLGAFRPTCRGPFGTFEVTGWEVLSQPEDGTNDSEEPDEDDSTEPPSEA